MSRGELLVSRWLEAHSDRSASLTTIPGSLALADVAGDGDYRLVLTDLKLEPDVRSRLKVYKGTVLASDQGLPDVPCGLISFYTDKFEPRIPAVAVACGSELLIYKNNKPYFKFAVPQLPVTALEKDVWKKLEGNSNKDGVANAINELKAVPYNTLSTRSQHLLALQNESEPAVFVEKHKNSEPTKLDPITCLAVLNKNSQDKSAVACPVVATENGHLYILDPQSFAILHEASSCSSKATPSMVVATGSFDIEFRILVACRENLVCLIRRTWLEGKVLLQTTAHIVDMVLIPGDGFIFLATTDQMLHCYTKRGHRLWSSQMVHPVTCLCLVPLPHLSISLVAVGLKGGSVHLYKGRHPVDFTSVPDTPSAITFGQLGQEDHVMVVITSAGTINFKILKRTADFSVSNQDVDSSPLYQNKPWPLPKRSKLFLEQSMRERQNAVDMHQNFQQDLVRLRLIAARATVENLSDQTGSGNEHEQIKMAAQVMGLGPKFTLVLTLENMNAEKALTGLTIVFHTKTTLFTLSSYVIKVPLVPPGLSFKTVTKVTEVVNDKDEENVPMTQDALLERIIRVFVVRESQSKPVLAAAIKMPPVELYYT